MHRAKELEHGGGGQGVKTEACERLRCGQQLCLCLWLVLAACLPQLHCDCRPLQMQTNQLIPLLLLQGNNTAQALAFGRTRTRSATVREMCCFWTVQSTTV